MKYLISFLFLLTSCVSHPAANSGNGNTVVPHPHYTAFVYAHYNAGQLLINVTSQANDRGAPLKLQCDLKGSAILNMGDHNKTVEWNIPAGDNQTSESGIPGIKGILGINGSESCGKDTLSYDHQ